MRFKPIYVLIPIVPAGLLIGMAAGEWAEPAMPGDPADRYMPARSGAADRLPDRSAAAVPRDALIAPPPFRSRVDYSVYGAGEETGSEDYPQADPFAAEAEAERAAIAAASAVSEVQAAEAAAQIGAQEDEQPAAPPRSAAEPPAVEPERASGLPAIW